ncbi:hypothetical protein [Streptomyces sp. NPDC055642]
MSDVEREDIAAMRREGGGAELRAFMRAQIDIGRARREPTRPAAAPRPPGHRPGAWPTGSSPPGRPPEWDLPPAVWDAAVRHYRNTEHFPDRPCDCGNCPPEPEETQ